MMPFDAEKTSNPKCTFNTHTVMSKALTWSRDSHGLFDFESKNLTKKRLNVNDPSMYMRHGNDVHQAKYDASESFQNQRLMHSVSDDDKALVKIVNHNNCLYVESAAYQPHKVDQDIKKQADGKKTQENMYLVVRSLKHNDVRQHYDIQEKDILKIGRIKFAVKEIGYSIESQAMVADESEEMKEKGHTANSIFTTSNDEEWEEFEEVQAITKGGSGKEDEKCRFCYSDEATVENPLLISCKCAGSVGYLHLACLKQWLNFKMTKQQVSEGFTSIFWKAFECEICKHAYPLTFKAQNKKYNLVEYEKPTGDFLVLESLSHEKNTSRIIHVIKPSLLKSEFKLGRGHNADLRINDISVSRVHSMIKLQNGKFILEDNDSKFGTMVLVKQRTPLLPLYNKAVQVGRTVVNFCVKENKTEVKGVEIQETQDSD